MKEKATSIFIFLVLLATSAFAQTGTLSGVVTDSQNDELLINASIYVEELERGAVTDINGEYSISNIPSGTYNVRVSFVGFTTLEQQVSVQGNTTQNFELTPDVFGLDELVVSGYSLVPRRDLTGSVSQVSGRDIEGLDIQSPDQALQARIPGARVTNLSGQPGGGVNIRIRGVGSINASNDPLFIVDGVPISDVDGSATLGSSSASNALNGINPRDIQSIEILKDAAAAAIYGAQAANGVVLITTKRGRAGDTQFNFSTSVGFSEELKRHEIIEGPEWVELQYEAFEWWGELNNYSESYWQGVAANNLGGYTLADVQNGDVPHYDWQDALMRTGVNRRYNLSASGGNEQTRFYMAGAFNNVEGVAIETGMQRYNLRANIDHKANDRVSVEFNANVAKTDQVGALQNGFYFGSPFYIGQRMRPTSPIKNEDGTYGEVFNGYNPLASLELDDRESSQKQLIGNFAGTYNITDHFNFRSNWALDYRVVDDIRYDAPESPAGEDVNGYRYDANREVTNFTTNQVFNYFNEFQNIHNLRALAGFEYRREIRDTFTASGQGFPSGLFRTLQNAAEPYSVSGFGSEFRIASFFTKADYRYDDKYLVSGSLRYDGSSRFGEDNRWGLFYAGSLGWVISEESFMDATNSWLDELKLRASYGVTGNTSGISNFASRQLFGSGGAYQNQPALTASSLGNNLLTWEESATLNFGLTWQMLDGRVYGSADIYRRNNTALLLDRELPSDSGFGDLTENAGEVRNEGIEFEVGAVLLDVSGFVWTSDFNITFQRNELIALNEGAERIGSSYFVGRPLTNYYMYRYAGVNPADGRPMFYDRNGDITYTPTTGSTLEEDDRYFVGDSSPSPFGGWSNQFNYKGFQLDVLFQFNYGQKTYNSFMGSFTDGAFFRRGGLQANSRNRWTEPGQITSVERAYVNSSYPGRTSGFTTSTRFLEDASYIRLKNVQLGYTIPRELISQIGLRNASIFVQGTNLLTWTNYTGIDPEILGSNSGVYPQFRTITSGIEIGF